MSDKTTPRGRRWALRGTATFVGVVLAVGTLGAAHFLGTPSSASQPVGRTVTPVPANAQRVCAGSILQLADANGGDATTASRLGKESVVATSSTGRVSTTRLGASSSGGSAPALLTAAAGAATPAVAGSGTQDVEQSDVSGLAAAACADTSASSWLVGGSTQTGRTSLITLSNPTAVNATVDLDVFDSSGKVSAPGTTGIVVAPHAQKVIPLAGFVSGASSPVVHVTSTGGQVVAMMQETVIRTLTPGGVDIVQSGAGPSLTQVIPGVVLRKAEQAQEGADSADAAPIVRVFVPGAKQASLTLSIRTADGGGTTVNATAQPGIVTDIPLDDFSDGTYSVTIAANHPVVAGARTSTPTTGGKTDLGWFASAPALSSSTLADVVDGPSARITFVNTTRQDATVRLRSGGGSGGAGGGSGSGGGAGGGSTQEITVTSGSTATIAVPTSKPLRITHARGLYAGVTYSGATGIAGFPVRSAPSVSTPITVYP
jgi:hypothetical protein